MCLAIQILTGIALAKHYVPHIELAFDSVEHIMREVNYGWLLRYTHANGASMFFVAIYMHMGRGLYYRSYVYPRQYVWITGLILLLLLFATAFLGYVLPWGQMSFWGATVITNFFSTIPLIGEKISYFIWGGFGVNDATLKRFFVIHFALPFIMSAITAMHILLLHNVGSNNPLGVASPDLVRFSPNYHSKDLLGILVFLLLFILLVFFYPNALGHADNYIRANPLVTPAHIVPEWYFWPFYAILRAIPSKLGGVVLMALSLIIHFFLPYWDNTGPYRGPAFRPMFKFLFFGFIASFLFLGKLGQSPMEEPYITLSRISTAYYFLFFLFLRPLGTHELVLSEITAEVKKQ